LRGQLEADSFQADPHALLRTLTESGPAHRCEPVGAPAQWLVTGYDAARAVLADPRVTKRSEHAGLEPGWLMSGARDEVGIAYMLTVDPPEHTRLRAKVAPAFAPRRIEELRPGTRAVAERLLDEVATRRTPELVGEFATLLPIAVICELLGVPAADRSRFSWAAEQIASPVAGSDRNAAYEWMGGYLAAQIAAKKASPGPDLLSELASDTSEDRLDAAELVGMAFLLLIAGYETSEKLISAVILGLIRRPDLLRALREDPGLLPAAVEEFLRLGGPVLTGTERFAAEDIQIGDVQVRRGDMLLVSFAAANRDASRFEAPDEFRFGRSAGHLSFGHGVHYCLGATLARMEAEVAIGALLERVQSLDLAVDESELEWTAGLLLHGVKRLPVTAVYARTSEA
jgi:cytochrome P450